MNRRYQSFLVLIVTALFVWTGYSACIKNACIGVVCTNGGVCVDGLCACPYGYEGANCETEWYKKYAGTWAATDKLINDTSGNLNAYSVHIEGSRDSFFIYGLADTLTVKCKITSLYGFTIAEQRPDSNTTITYGKASFDTTSMAVTGIYSIKKTDTVVTARFSWKR